MLLKGKLTEREVQVCRKMIEGKSNKVIAKELCISEKTLKTHVHNILGKLGLKSRYQIALLWKGEESINLI